MKIATLCTHCSARYSVDERALGRSLTCQSCQQKFVVAAEPQAEEFSLLDDQPPAATRPAPARPAPRPAPAQPRVVAAPAAAASYSPNIGDLLDDAIAAQPAESIERPAEPPPPKKVKKKKVVSSECSSSGSSSDSGGSGAGMFAGAAGTILVVLVLGAKIVGRVLEASAKNGASSTSSQVSPPLVPGTSGSHQPQSSGGGWLQPANNGPPQFTLSSPSVSGSIHKTCSVQYTNTGGDPGPGQQIYWMIRDSQGGVMESTISGIDRSGTLRGSGFSGHTFGPGGQRPPGGPYSMSLEMDDRGSRRVISNVVTAP